MCSTPNTDPFGNVIRSCYCEAQDIAAAQSAELATLRAENESAQKSLRLIEMYLDNGEPHSALRVAKEALK